jgi:hypothetical protein
MTVLSHAPAAPAPDLPSSLEPEATAFCKQEGLLPFVATALDLLRTHFPQAYAVRWEPDRDPESGERWLGLHFTVEGEVERILDQYDALIDAWNEAVPWPQSDRLSFLYEIV